MNIEALPTLACVPRNDDFAGDKFNHDKRDFAAALRTRLRVLTVGYGAVAMLMVLLAGGPAIAQVAANPKSVDPDTLRHADVPTGKIEGPYRWTSEIFPGTERDYWLYVPANTTETSLPA